MIGLARDLARAGEPVLNLLFHSSEAIVGGSPYTRTDAELTAFCDRLEQFFAYAVGTLKAQPATFVEFRRAYAAATHPAPTPQHPAPTHPAPAPTHPARTPKHPAPNTL
jgi:hypothetical protein